MLYFIKCSTFRTSLFIHFDLNFYTTKIHNSLYFRCFCHIYLLLTFISWNFSNICLHLPVISWPLFQLNFFGSITMNLLVRQMAHELLCFFLSTEDKIFANYSSSSKEESEKKEYTHIRTQQSDRFWVLYISVFFSFHLPMSKVCMSLPWSWRRLHQWTDVTNRPYI